MAMGIQGVGRNPNFPPGPGPGRAEGIYQNPHYQSGRNRGRGDEVDNDSPRRWHPGRGDGVDHDRPPRRHPGRGDGSDNNPNFPDPKPDIPPLPTPPPEDPVVTPPSPTPTPTPAPQPAPVPTQRLERSLGQTNETVDALREETQQLRSTISELSSRLEQFLVEQPARQVDLESTPRRASDIPVRINPAQSRVGLLGVNLLQTGGLFTFGAGQSLFGQSLFGAGTSNRINLLF